MYKETINPELSATESSEIMTPDEMVNYIKMPSKKALYAMVSRHEIPFIKLGRRLRFIKSDIDAHLLNKRVPAMDSANY